MTTSEDKVKVGFDDLGAQTLEEHRRAGARLPRRRHAARISRSAQSRTDKPSIAVLPFTNMSGDPEQEYFQRRHHRGHHHRAVALPLALRHRPEFIVRLQGKGNQGTGDREGTRRRLCRRRQRAQGRFQSASPLMRRAAKCGSSATIVRRRILRPEIGKLVRDRRRHAGRAPGGGGSRRPGTTNARCRPTADARHDALPDGDPAHVAAGRASSARETASWSTTSRHPRVGVPPKAP